MKKIGFPYCVTFETISAIYGLETDSLFCQGEGMFEYDEKFIAGEDDFE